MAFNRILLFFSLVWFLCWAALPPALAGSSPQAAAPAQGSGQEKVDQLLNLLDDPEVQGWLRERKAEQPPSDATGPAATPAAEMSSSEHMIGADLPGYFAGRLMAIHAHLRALSSAIPVMPDDVVKAAAMLQHDLQGHNAAEIVLLLLCFAALGAGVEWGMRRLWRPVRHWLIGFKPRNENDRLIVVLIRLCYGISMVAAFAIGSVGAFLLFEWPMLLRHMVLAYLCAALAFRLTVLACRFALAPGAAEFRIMPMPTPAAWFWYRRLSAFVFWFAFGWATVAVLRVLGVAPPSRELIAYVLGIGLLVIAIEATWRRPIRPPSYAEDHQRIWLQLSPPAISWLLSAYYVLLWLLWIAGTFPMLWTLVIAVMLPLSIRLANGAVRHLLRPFEQEETTDALPETRSVAVVCLDRGLRTLLIVVAAYLLAKAWQVDMVALAAQDTVLMRLARGAINAVIILLIGDLVWHIAKTVIDRKMIAAAADSTTTTEDERRRHQRLQTLLPIVRNMLFITLLIMVALMALSSLGVEIGPLIAGAGVVGVAIGFGAQTLVKDIISGIFYLFDDAFRIGEYIQSGSYKGTVESFSLRSVKLRHQRGPLYTVPFGVLGAVQNMSRDWVIEKLSVNVPYDTNLEKVRKLIKEIGKTLAADPEFGKNILDPLKMQGVEQFGDFAIQIRMKMMTRPGEQFVVRRRAYAMIKSAFDENGIKFARPTVQVAGGDETAGVAAQAALAPKAEAAD